MKKFKMISLLILMTIFSCSDDDDVDNNAYIPNETIIDNWTLVKSTGTIAGITHEFPSGTIIWTFNINNTVTIINNNTDENLQSGFASGTYPYSVAANSATASCEKKITIDTNQEFLCFTLADTQMDIIQGVDDGINYHFERVMPFEID
ncbi:hypothetical protein [Flavobacterium sp. SM2513]|uniref:hypothetical protein n=1 Tax=Flavobacterium sp. SM2513 TaxID=3424766 RepID=UPI003D7FDE08